MLSPILLSIILTSTATQASVPDADLARASSLLQSGQWNEARAGFETALERDPFRLNRIAL